MLQLSNVTKIYKTKSGSVKALDGVSLTFPSTGMVFVSGKSGCGKTTLLNVIGGLDGIDGGDISLFGKSFSSFNSSDYNDYRNTFVGFIFQEYNLLSEFTVEKNIELTMELQGEKCDKPQLAKLLNDVDILDLKNRKPNELSGGQRQRVAIARALVKNPRIIMADEPTGALDSNTGIQVLDTLKKLSKDKLVIVVSHDREFAEKYADRLIRLVDGKVVEDVTFTDNSLDYNVYQSDNALLVKDGATLSDSDKDAIADAVKNKRKIEVIENLSFREKHVTDQAKLTADSNQLNSSSLNMKKSKMKLKSSFLLALKSLGVKPVRLVFTIFLSVIAFAVFGLFDTVANFSNVNVVNNLLKNSNVISVDGSYYLNYDKNDYYNLKFSEEFISSLSSSSRLKTKGIYTFSANTSGIVDEKLSIYELANSDVDTGKHYFSNAFNGFIEFSDKEIDQNGNFSSFGYKLVGGKYPKLQPYSSGDATYASMHEIAISTYMAQSIVNFLGDKPLNDVEINAASDLLDKTLTIDGEKYTIVGLVDCGSLPAKYDVLKYAISLSSTEHALASEALKLINSSAYKCIFVADGLLENYKKQNSSPVYYYSGNCSWAVKGDFSSSTSANRYVYAFDDFSKDNFFFFDSDGDNAKNCSLANDQVLISPNNLITLLNERYAELNQDDMNQVKSLISTMTALNYSLETKSLAFDSIVQLLSIPSSFNVNVTKTSTKTKEKITKTLQVVGVYVDVDSKIPSSSTVRFMMNDKLMDSFNVFNQQGDYSRIMLSPNSSLFGSKIIADYITRQDGLAFGWYGNYALSIIQQNEALVRQGADLFLYIALVLAAFSIFMLFNYIATSIINKRQSIGVLRGLGANGKDVLLMFLIESLIIAIINGVLAVGFGALGCVFVNMYIANVMNVSIPFALFSIRQVIVIFAMSILTAIISSAIPIWKITREKPVDLIRKS